MCQYQSKLMSACTLAFTLLVLASLSGTLAVRFPALDVYKGSGAPALYAGPNKLQSKCEEHFRNTTLDHFSWVIL